MKSLAQAVKDYLSLRRSLGFKLQKHERLLREFLAFLELKRANRISNQLALEFATRNQHHRPAEWAVRLRVVRGFACYRIGEDPDTQIPALGLLPFRSLRAQPYVYSAKEIRKRLKAAQHMPATYTLKPWTYYCLFGLLVVTGLRVSEALNLQGKDVDWSEGVLTIRGAKVGKSRLIPLHASTLRVLSAYAKRRDRFFGNKPVSHFFVSSAGTRLNRSYVSRTFRQLSRQIGLRAACATHGPRLHDFRHRFAVQTLVRWYRQGKDVERRLPILSTYLGHVRVSDTYWYITCTPELRGVVGQRMEKRWGGLL